MDAKIRAMIAGELARVARMLVAYKYGDVQVLLLKGAGVEASPSELAGLMKSGDADVKRKIDNSVKAKQKLESSVRKWAKFSGEQDEAFVEYAWFLLGLGAPLLVPDGDGGGKTDEKAMEKLHDSWTLYRHFLGTNEVGKEAGALRRKVQSRAVGYDGFVKGIGEMKEKYRSMTVNSHLETDEKEAWEKLERGRKWNVNGFAVYKVDDFLTLNSVAGKNAENPTQWCVALERKFFDDYQPPYYMFVKNGVPETLVHLESRQAKDCFDDVEARDDAVKAVIEFLKREFSYKEVDMMELQEECGARPDGFYNYVVDNGLMGDDWNSGDDFACLTGGYDSHTLLGNGDIEKIKAHFIKSGEECERYLDEHGDGLSTGAKIGLASNPKATPKVLRRLAEDEDRCVRSEVALNRNLHDMETFLLLSKDEWLPVKRNLLRNENVPAGILKGMALHNDDLGLLCDIARSSKATSDILDILSSCGNEDVLFWVARNSNCSQETLSRLFKDKSTTEKVKCEIVDNLRSIDEFEDEIINGDSEALRRVLAWRKQYDEDTLIRIIRNCSVDTKINLFVYSPSMQRTDGMWRVLAGDASDEVRMAVASRGGLLPVDVLENLRNDPVEAIRKKAEKFLQERKGD